MWSYEQTTGQLCDPVGTIITIGYSGHANGLNNPNLQNVSDVGPIPQGLWDIGEPYDSQEHGPYVLPLAPQEGTDTFGRSGFKIHGDEIAHVGEHLASLGCIILPRPTREKIWESGDRALQVVR